MWKCEKYENVKNELLILGLRDVEISLAIAVVAINHKISKSKIRNP
jgi:hypothetical protein